MGRKALGWHQAGISAPGHLLALLSVFGFRVGWLLVLQEAACPKAAPLSLQTW